MIKVCNIISLIYNFFETLFKILESLPIVTFFVLYKFYNIFVATAGIAISSIIVTAITYVKTKSLSKFSIFNTIILLVLSGLTISLGDSKFVKMKPTAIYSFVAIFLTVDLLYLKKYYVQKLYSQILQDKLIDTNIWKKITSQLIIVLVLIGSLNEVIWRFIGEEAWVNFKVFIVPLILIFVLLIHINFLSKKTST
jgi:intracellular septation protein